MSKLVYPNDGIYVYHKNDILTCSSTLQKAILESDLDVPSDFAYAGYLSGLRSLLTEYYEELEKIDVSLENSNNNYQNLTEELSTDAKKMIPVEIKDRERMIV